MLAFAYQPAHHGRTMNGGRKWRYKEDYGLFHCLGSYQGTTPLAMTWPFLYSFMGGNFVYMYFFI